MEYLWIYLGLSAAFSGGFLVCAPMLSWHRIELAHRQAQHRIDILNAATQWCLREVQEFSERRTRMPQRVPPEAIERHWRS